MENKLTVWSVVATSALLLTATGCSDDNYSGATDSGGLRIELDIDPGAISSAPQQAPQSRASLAEIGAALTAEQFTIRLTGEDGQAHEWPYDQFDGSKVKIGTYTVTAFYGEEGTEGFDHPYFEASQQVTVVTDRTSNVSLTAALANAAVNVTYTDAFRNYMQTFVAEVRTSGSENAHVYPADANGELFINAGEAALYVSFTTKSGQSATLKAAEFTAAPRHAYNITVDVNGGEVGDGVLTVTFDDSTTAETREFELSEELLNAPAPEITPATTSLDMVQGLLPQGVDQVALNVVARGKLDEVTLTTTNPALIAKGWPAEIDLMKASADQQALLKQLGLKAMGLWKNPDRMAVIDLTEVVKGLDSDAGFRLEVVDRYGKVSDPAAVVSVNVTPVTMNIAGHSVFLVGDTSASLTLEYNGPALSTANVQAEYLTDRGNSIWDAATVKSVTATADGKYTILLEGLPDNTLPVQVRLTVNGVSATCTLERGVPEFAIAATANNTFATYALVDVTSSETNPAELASKLAWQVSTDGTNYSAATAKVNGSTVTISGLTPGATNYIKASIASVEKTASVAAEAATQLPNAGMEDWVIGSSKSHWECLYPSTSTDNTVWGTANPLTTSQGNDFMANYAYDAISGTISTSIAVSKEDRDASTYAAHSGSNAAVIRTVGWGSGNTAVGSNGSSGKCKYTDAGLLHLGANRTSRGTGISTDDLTTGYAFASRPSALSFWYKYLPKNPADKGYAEITVFDASGNQIARQTANLDAASSYTKKTVALAYPANAAKGAKIYVKFLSTYDAGYLNRTDDNFSGPGFANTTRGTFMGSQLIIDDITLDY